MEEKKWLLEPDEREERSLFIIVRVVVHSCHDVILDKHEPSAITA